MPDHELCVETAGNECNYYTGIYGRGKINDFKSVRKKRLLFN